MKRIRNFIHRLDWTVIPAIAIVAGFLVVGWKFAQLVGGVSRAMP